MGGTWFYFVILPLPLSPPASFSFYKKVSENLLQAKIGEKSVPGHVCLYLSLKDPPVPCVRTAICWRDMHVLLALGSVFLGFTTNSFFHVVGILKQHSFI